MGTPRLLVVFSLATLGVVLIIAALATGEWWMLIPAVLAHATGTVLAVGAIGKALKQRDKPDPLEEARIEGEQRARGDDDSGDKPKMAI